MPDIFIPGNLSPETRALMLEVWAGENGTLPHLHLMAGLYDRDRVLAWLVANKKTGKDFLDLIRGHFSGSLLETISYVMMRINHEKEQKPIIVGKDIQ